jgi:hypothetical protein
MYFRYIFFAVFCSCSALAASAQQIIVKGLLYKKASQERMAQVAISNHQTNGFGMSDNLGRFQISANLGDTLVFNKIGYTTMNFVVYSPTEVVLYLQPVILLNTVTIKAESRKNEINDVINTYRKKGLYFDGRPPISVFSPFGGSPITGFYELFSKDARNERHFIKITREESDRVEVNKRYNASLIKRVTGETDDKEIQYFRDMFTPSFEDIKEWNEYELISYIKRSFEYFKKTQNRPKLPKLY